MSTPPNSTPIKIRTTASNLEVENWSRFTYELAHELTHYAIRQQKKNKDVYLNWFEETICEAMSMYILRLVATRWSECPLYALKNKFGQSLEKFGQSFENYRNDIYNKTSDSILKKCSSYAELKRIEDDCYNDRIGRSIDRNYLYDTFVSMPNDIKNVIYYTQYIKLNGLQVDFDAWKTDNRHIEPFIVELGSIQPQISA